MARPFGGGAKSKTQLRGPLRISAVSQCAQRVASTSDQHQMINDQARECSGFLFFRSRALAHAVHVARRRGGGRVGGLCWVCQTDRGAVLAGGAPCARAQRAQDAALNQRTTLWNRQPQERTSANEVRNPPGAGAARAPPQKPENPWQGVRALTIALAPPTSSLSPASDACSQAAHGAASRRGHHAGAA